MAINAMAAAGLDDNQGGGVLIRINEKELMEEE
jgi:hypothetical protein